MIKKLRVTVDGNTYDVTVELPEETAVVPPASSPSPAPVTPAAPAPAPAAPRVSVPAAPPPAVSSGPAGPGDVPSPLAGRVTAVVVTVGQAVQEGDHLLTLEAMKMNTFVFAPRPGKVLEIKTAVGDAVGEGQVLARIG